MLTSAIGDSRNKNAKNEDSKGKDNTEKGRSKARPPCFWGLRTANAFRVGHEAHWGRTKGYSNVHRHLLGGTKQTSPQSYRLQAGQKRNQVKC